MDCVGGPASPATPISGASCVSVCEQVFDFDVDGDVDISDASEMMILLGQ